MGWDVELFRWINHWPENIVPVFWWLSQANKTTQGRLTMAVLVLALIIYKPTRYPAIIGLLSFPLANGITEVFKTVFPGPRPCMPGMEAPDLILRVPLLTSWGTASSHASNTLAYGFAFVLANNKQWPIWVSFGILTGISRIVVGAHYPAQVLLGWLCGIFAVFLVHHTWQAIVRIKKSNASQSEESSSQHDQTIPLADHPL